MIETGRIEPLLDGIYDAAVDTTRWPLVLEQLAAHLGSCSAHLTIDVAGDAGSDAPSPRMISFGTDPGYVRSYAEYYAARNVFWDRLVARSLTGVMTNRILMSKDEARRSEFYNDYLRPQDGEEILGALASRDGRIGTSFTFWRPERSGPWQKSDMERLSVLAPHLQRAVRIADHFGAMKALNGFSAEALYRLGRGFFIVTSSARLMFASGAAENLLDGAGGLNLRQQRLTAEQPAETDVLHELIAAAAQRKRGGSMIITRGEAAPLLVMVIPVRIDSWGMLGNEPGAMVATKDLNPAAPRPLDALSRHFGLTPAETRAASELLLGDGIAAVARRLRVSEATARTHRIRVFQKTGVRRQAELVRLILEWSDDAMDRP